MNGMMNSIVISKVKGACCSNKKSLSIDEMRAELAADADTLKAFNAAYGEKTKKGAGFKETGFGKACKIYNEWKKNNKEKK